MILGGGPNRIGQGIEFDYCCVQAVFGLRDAGYKSIMVNCNPETVSTDLDLADRLYFEPITFEDIMNIIDFEQPDGVLVQFGGQTPLKIANALTKAGVKVFGTSAKSINLAENREEFAKIIKKLGWKPKITLKEMVHEMMENDINIAKRDCLVKKHGFKAPDYIE